MRRRPIFQSVRVPCLSLLELCATCVGDGGDACIVVVVVVVVLVLEREQGREGKKETVARRRFSGRGLARLREEVKASLSHAFVLLY